ncbi:MAG: sulfotransferase [Bacteroidota bacterium]
MPAPPSSSAPSPRSLFIVGSPRSGSSLVAGLLADPRYHFGNVVAGNRVMTGDARNPKGYFETGLVNRINEAILAPSARRLDGLFKRPFRGQGLIRRLLLPHVTTWGEHLLYRFPAETTFAPPPLEIVAYMQQVVKPPFCLKDPRFCYTLSFWQALAPQAGTLCVFRDPYVTARSMLAWPWALTPKQALQIWTCQYRYALQQADDTEDWLFLHYDQALDGSAWDRLAAFSHAALQTDFPERTLKRSKRLDASPYPPADALYADLCERAGYEAGRTQHE